MKRKVAWLTKNDLSMKVESSREKLQKLIMQAKSANRTLKIANREAVSQDATGFFSVGGSQTWGRRLRLHVARTRTKDDVILCEQCIAHSVSHTQSAQESHDFPA